MVLKDLSHKPDEQVILVADDDDHSRKQIADVLTAHGYDVMQAIDGGTALKVVKERNIILTILDEHMSPRGGFEFIKDLEAEEIRMPILMISDDRTTDLLTQATRYGIPQVLEKPVDPARITEAVRRVLKAYKVKLKKPLIQKDFAKVTFQPEELMKRAIALGLQNKNSGMGGPFGAVVADKDGQILGEGTNNVVAHSDPLGHAEATAIRRAAEKLGSHRLDGCVLYASCEPTMLGQALIYSTGIAKVYYALTHEDVGASRQNEEGILGEVSKPMDQRDVSYERLMQDDARGKLS